MSLIEIYISEVTRRLPEKCREDIAVELRSTIEDMLPDHYSEENVKTVLEKLGNPAALASGYRDQPMHLIGPRYFDVYISLLKMILPIATVVSLISLIAETFIGYQGEEAILNVILSSIGIGIWRFIEVGVQVFFWITIVFAVLERTDKGKDDQPLTVNCKKWKPDDLKNITYIPKKRSISKVEVFGGLMWTAIWATLYFYADRLVGIYEGNGADLQFVAPAFNHDVLLGYWPIILVVIGFEIALNLYKLIKRQWTKKVSFVNAAFHLLGSVVIMVILMDPQIMNKDFIAYMADLFTISKSQFESSIVGGGIFIYVLSAAISVYDGFKKTRIH